MNNKPDASVIRDIYATREPMGCDTWSPLEHEIELWHRSRLMVEACRSLRLITKPVKTLKVLDVGCGVGRSSRLLVDLGIKPENIQGIDFRESAIDLAQRTNPAIRFLHINGLNDWPPGSFDLATQCTVFSSIPTDSFRAETAALMERSVGQDGYILWWDALKANAFAGGGALNPVKLFGKRRLIYLRHVPLRPQLNESIRSLRGMGRLVAALLDGCGYRPTHVMALFGPIKIATRDRA